MKPLPVSRAVPPRDITIRGRTAEDAKESHSVLPVNEFLEGTAANKISRILEERHLVGIPKQAGRKIVRLKFEGFDVWKPYKSKRIA